MRILHFINNIDLSWYTMLLDMLRAQERQGNDVFVVVPPSGSNYTRLKQDAVHVTPLEVRSSKFDYYASWRLSQILKEKNIDVLHTHLTSCAQLGSAAARMAGVPCASSVLKMTKKQRYMKSDKLMPCSDAVMEHLRNQHVPASFMRRVYTGIDFDRYKEGLGSLENARGEFGFGPDAEVIGVIARLVHMKGHSVLLNAFPAVAARRPDARLLIVGDGELREPLELQAASLGIKDKIVFAGTRRDLPRILNTINVSVLSSVEKEGLPVILVESALFGKPVVMTDVAGIKEVVRNRETGLLAPPNDPKALAKALIETLEKPDEAAVRARAALEFVRREFDVNYTTRQIEEVYREVIANKSKGGKR
jgi:glycosyltransferase involved in cell wall biosynthesis